MPPIPVFKDSAINPEKASGVTPQTAQDSTQQSGVTSNPFPATTTSGASPASYPAAQPGRPAFPAPTGTAQRYAPAPNTASNQPTPTTTFQAPPPEPQPGAFPTPSSRMPPPPKARETLSGTAARNYPPQMNIPSPTTAYAGQPPGSTTSTTTAPSSAYPVPLPGNYDGPAGYQQNPYAIDQRRAQDASSSHEGNESTGDMSSLAADAQNMWDTAKQWAQKAGEKLSEAETEVWKRVNK